MKDAYGRELEVGDRVAYTTSPGGKLFYVRRGTITHVGKGNSCTIQPDRDSKEIKEYRARRYQGYGKIWDGTKNIRTSAKVLKLDG